MKNLKRNLKVRITKEHIERAYRNRKRIEESGSGQYNECCVIAEALKSQGHDRVKVRNSKVLVGAENYLHSPKSKQVILQFDMGLPVRPTTVELTRENI